MSGEELALATAIRRHEERLAREPGSLAFAQLADLYRKAGRPGEAVRLCREGLARYPHYTTARLILAKAHLAEGDLDAAAAEVRTLLATAAGDTQCHRLAADVHRRRGDLEAAGRHLETVLALEPGDREAAQLVELLRGDAPADASGVARVLRDDTFATGTFGRVCLEQGLFEEAALVFTRLVRRNPDDHDARAGLEAALRGRTRRRG